MNAALKIKPKHTTGAEAEAMSRICQEYKAKLDAGDPSPDELAEIVAFLKIYNVTAYTVPPSICCAEDRAAGLTS